MITHWSMFLPCVLSLWKVYDQINARGFYQVCACGCGVGVCMHVHMHLCVWGGMFVCCWFGTFAFSPASTSQLQELQVGTTVTMDLVCFVIVVAGDSTYASGQQDPNNHTETILITTLFG